MASRAYVASGVDSGVAFGVASGVASLLVWDGALGYLYENQPPTDE